MTSFAFTQVSHPIVVAGHYLMEPATCMWCGRPAWLSVAGWQPVLRWQWQRPPGASDHLCIPSSAPAALGDSGGRLRRPSAGRPRSPAWWELCGWPWRPGLLGRQPGASDGAGPPSAWVRRGQCCRPRARWLGGRAAARLSGVHWVFYYFYRLL